MPKDNNVVGIVLLLLILNKRSSLFHDLHKMTELLDKIDHVSHAVNSLPNVGQLIQNIGPMLSMLETNSLPNYDDYIDENRNAIF